MTGGLTSWKATPRVLLGEGLTTKAIQQEICAYGLIFAHFVPTMSRVNLGSERGSSQESGDDPDRFRRGFHLLGDNSQPSSGVGPAPGSREPIYGISVAAQLTGVT